MSLLELKTPYHLVRVVDYGDSDIARIQNRRLQCIIDNFYKDKETQNGSGDYSCKLYAFYPEIKTGIYLNYLHDIEQYTPEKVRETCIRGMVDSFSRYQNRIRGQIHNGMHIKNTSLLLLEIYAPELAKDAKRAKKEYLERLDAEECQVQQDNIKKQWAAIIETNELAVKKLMEVADAIRLNSNVPSSDISFYKTNKRESVYNCFNLLTDIYCVKTPASVRGWIAENCLSIKLCDNEITAYRHRGGKSQTFHDYMQRMIDKVIADSESIEIKKWRDRLCGPTKEAQAA